MAKNNKHSNDIKKRQASVRRFLSRLANKYLPGVDIKAVGSMSEAERKALLLEIVNRTIRKPAFCKTPEMADREAEFKAYLEENAHKLKNAEGKQEIFEETRKFTEKMGLGDALKLERMQREVWELSMTATTTPRTDCPLNDMQTVNALPPNERQAVMFMRDLCRYGGDFAHYVESTYRKFFPELKGDLTIVNPTVIQFVEKTEYRNIAADLLANAANTLRASIPMPSEELKAFAIDIDNEVTRYDKEGLSDPEVFIMRIMAMISYAVSELHLLDYWKERGQGK